MAAEQSDPVAETIRQYVALLSSGSADDIVALFADDATVEDPVGGEVRAGRKALHAFYSELERLDRDAELNLLRTAGQEAAFVFTITFSVGGTQMRLQPVDTVTFNDDGKIAALRSFFAQSDIVPA